ncbi:MAG TPA: LON peptidase substrate-binding domain-containing protein [Acidimicrobiales bacterium]|nr:LON peptidase substrate-binding domain-containing protein [Acidimicrobiales bacterium]
MPVLPMFPLGSVVVPGMLVPLHVFEARYRRLVADCLAGDGTFGTVLIERGSEVGGGDIRTHVGTSVRIVRADQLDDGRWALAAVGMHRLRVTAWLPDDPYPRAEVEAWPDEEPAAGDTAGPALAEVAALLRRAAALLAELGEPAPPLDVELADDPGVAGFQAAALAPLGPVDRQALLSAPSSPARLALLRSLLADPIEVLTARLAAG